MPRYLPALLIGVVSGGLLVSAQVTTGTISGIVQDASGAAVVGGTVTIRNLDTGTARNVVTDSGGAYIAPDLSLGNYEVQAQQSGFQTEVRIGINLTVHLRQTGAIWAEGTFLKSVAAVSGGGCCWQR